MAFEKTLTFPNGLSGNYIRITGVEWSRLGHRVTFVFSLYASAAKAASHPDNPIWDRVAVLRAEGAEFDTNHMPSVVALAEDDFYARVYEMAKLGVSKCDFGTDVFADALDV